MSGMVQVTIHSSQFPDRVWSDLLGSLRTRKVNHKFHYDSVKQTQKWLALHAAFSPARTDPDCIATYDRSFSAAAGRMAQPRVHLVGLGCGGGQKDTRLLQRLRDQGAELAYTPVDVSVPMVLTARQAALAVVPAERCWPFVCDLAAADELRSALEARRVAGAARLLTFFGMLPNFEPPTILPRLATLLQPADMLLASANLAPGLDYDAGIQRVLPLYDNTLTRDWLITFLLDLGIESHDGQLSFRIEEGPADGGLKRIAAYFQFDRSREVQVADQSFQFRPGESIRLFFSYRHTPERVRESFVRHGLEVLDQWITTSGEEGIFLARIRA